MLFVPASRSANIVYCDEQCLSDVGAHDSDDALWVDLPFDCISCYSCGLGFPGTACLCAITGGSCFGPIWELSAHPRIMLDTLLIVLGVCELGEQDWNRALDLADELWDGHQVAAAMALPPRW